MQPQYSTYNSTSFDSSNHIYSSVTVDGYTQMGNTEYCPAAKGAIHTPKAYNVLNTTGGWQTGSSAPAASYISVSNAEQIVGVPGIVYYDQVQTLVVCSVVGNFYGANVSDYAEIATTKSVRTGPSTSDGVGGFITPVGQFCDAAHYPPDFNPAFADTWSSSASYFIGSAICVRLGSGHPWICSPGVASPLPSPQSPFACTHNP